MLADPRVVVDRLKLIVLRGDRRLGALPFRLPRELLSPSPETERGFVALRLGAGGPIADLDGLRPLVAALDAQGYALAYVDVSAEPGVPVRDVAAAIGMIETAHGVEARPDFVPRPDVARILREPAADASLGPILRAARAPGGEAPRYTWEVR